MNDTVKKITKTFHVKKILIPIILGLLAASYLLYKNLTEEKYLPVSKNQKGDYVWYDLNKNGKIDIKKGEMKNVGRGKGNYYKLTYKDTLKDINWTKYSYVWLALAIIMMAVRDIAYMYRIRVLTDNKLSWKKSFDVIMLWEFASAITPSVVGGAGIAVFIIHKEKIKLGRSTAVVMLSALLDEFFYIIMVPLLILITGTKNLFPLSLEKQIFGIELNTKGIFVIGYLFIFILTLIISYGIFIRPRGFKYIILKIFKLPLLKKWLNFANETGDDIITTSKEIKNKEIVFWLKAIISTFLSWTARFWVVNFIIMAFTPVNNHFLIYARQLIMWVIMLISPTPGGSGIAEFAFSGFLQDFIPFGFAGACALIWRLISYYLYLFIGIIVLPNWISRVFKIENK